MPPRRRGADALQGSSADVRFSAEECRAAMKVRAVLDGPDSLPQNALVDCWTEMRPYLPAWTGIEART